MVMDRKIAEWLLTDLLSYSKSIDVIASKNNLFRYNSQLIQDESSNFLVSVSSTESSASSLIVSALKSPGLLLDKTVTRCAIMADSSPTKVKGTNNVLVYKEVTDDRITFVIQNKSESSTNIQLDLSKSKNIITNK